MSEPAQALALDIARCKELPLAEANSKHPCAMVVGVQEGSGAARHVPEPWAGDLERGRILFLSSNPSLSEAGDHQSGASVERYPLAEWSNERMGAFFLRRFGNEADSPATPEGRFRTMSGGLSARKVAFWVGVRKRAQELLRREATPEADYCMTEVVHCKSKRERGVAGASALCAALHLDRVITLSPAALIVVLGGKARDRVQPLWELPAGFGGRASMLSDPLRSMAVRTLGTRARLVVYLPHPTGMEPLRTFDQIYVSRGLDVGAVARGEQSPTSFLPT